MAEEGAPKKEISDGKTVSIDSFRAGVGRRKINIDDRKAITLNITDGKHWTGKLIFNIMHEENPQHHPSVYITIQLDNYCKLEKKSFHINVHRVGNLFTSRAKVEKNGNMSKIFVVQKGTYIVSVA